MNKFHHYLIKKTNAINKYLKKGLSSLSKIENLLEKRKNKRVSKSKGSFYD